MTNLIGYIGIALVVIGVLVTLGGLLDTAKGYHSFILLIPLAFLTEKAFF